MLVSASIVARLFITLSGDSRSRPGGKQEYFIGGGLLMIITLYLNKALLKSISVKMVPHFRAPFNTILEA